MSSVEPNGRVASALIGISLIPGVNLLSGLTLTIYSLVLLIINRRVADQLTEEKGILGVNRAIEKSAQFLKLGLAMIIPIVSTIFAIVILKNGY